VARDRTLITANQGLALALALAIESFSALAAAQTGAPAVMAVTPAAMKWTTQGGGGRTSVRFKKSGKMSGTRHNGARLAYLILTSRSQKASLCVPSVAVRAEGTEQN
jgi:hypothetical protein